MAMGEISPSLVPLRDRFIALNVARARDLVELADRIDRGQDAEASLLAIGEIVHKVAGVALTLGFPESKPDSTMRTGRRRKKLTRPRSTRQPRSSLSMQQKR